MSSNSLEHNASHSNPLDLVSPMISQGQGLAKVITAVCWDLPTIIQQHPAAQLVFTWFKDIHESLRQIAALARSSHAMPLEKTGVLKEVEQQTPDLLVPHKALEKLLTKPQVAEVFGISTRTLDRWRDRQLIDAVQLPGSSRVLFRSQDVKSCIVKGMKRRSRKCPAT